MISRFDIAESASISAPKIFLKTNKQESISSPINHRFISSIHQYYYHYHKSNPDLSNINPSIINAAWSAKTCESGRAAKRFEKQKKIRKQIQDWRFFVAPPLNCSKKDRSPKTRRLKLHATYLSAFSKTHETHKIKEN